MVNNILHLMNNNLNIIQNMFHSPTSTKVHHEHSWIKDSLLKKGGFVGNAEKVCDMQFTPSPSTGVHMFRLLEGL